MVYFAYSHIAFVTLLTFAAVNAGEPWSKRGMIHVFNHQDISGVAPKVKAAIKEVQDRKDKILSQNESLQGGIEKYMNCLQTAYEYDWGEAALTEIADRLASAYDPALKATEECCRHEAVEYASKKAAFPLKNCFKNMPPAPHEDLHQLNRLTGILYDHMHWVAKDI
ncbi:unnamed protein product [Trichobilharzia szidati]|nr:unnamed protein product [Trichobilharzia szidati]